MDTVQKILVVVVAVLSTLLLVMGIQVFLIIQDVRKALKRLNSILDDSILGGGLLRPDRLTSIFQMFRKSKKFEKQGDGL